jgi:hypothetical protein
MFAQLQRGVVKSRKLIRPSRHLRTAWFWSQRLAYFVSQWWLLLPVLAGLNIVQAVLTGWCPAAMVFRRTGCSSGTAFKQVSKNALLLLSAKSTARQILSGVKHSDDFKDTTIQTIDNALAACVAAA